MISRRNLDPRALDLAVERPRSSLLPSSIQLLRCTAEAARPTGAVLLAVPAIRWSVGSIAGAHGSGDLLDPDTRIRFGGPACEPSFGAGVGPGCLGLSRVIRIVVAECVAGGRGGGDEETRTPDPLLAKEMLCRLSYVPTPKRRWWAFLDSNQRPLPYQGSALTS